MIGILVMVELIKDHYVKFGYQRYLELSHRGNCRTRFWHNDILPLYALVLFLLWIAPVGLGFAADPFLNDVEKDPAKSVLHASQLTLVKGLQWYNKYGAAEAGCHR